MVSQPVRHDAERGRQHELGREEHRHERSDLRRVDARAAQLRQVGEIEDERGAREGGAEAERECPDQDGPERAFHSR